MSLSFVYPPVTRAVLGYDLGTLNPSSTILYPRKARQAWCALGRAPAEWAAGSKGGVSVTQNPESACACGTVGSTAEHTRASVCTEPTGSGTRDSAPRNTHSFCSLLHLWLKPLFMFHAKWQRAFHILLRFSFIVFLAGAAKTIKDTMDFNPATVRKGSAFCWHSQLAELEWWHFHYPLPSWRIPALVGQALNCFTLLLHAFSLFP